MRYLKLLLAFDVVKNLVVCGALAEVRIRCESKECI